MALTPENLLTDAQLLAYPYVRVDRLSPAYLLGVLTQLECEVTDLYIRNAPERLSQQSYDIAVMLV